MEHEAPAPADRHQRRLPDGLIHRSSGREPQDRSRKSLVLADELRSHGGGDRPRQPAAPGGGAGPDDWGPSIPVNDATTLRRSLYFVHSHNDHQRFLTIFDDAGVLECYRRAQSIVPQQALALQNSGLSLSAAEKIAARLSGPELASDSAFVRAAFETILASTPTAQEQAECEAALKELRALAIHEKNPTHAVEHERCS